MNLIATLKRTLPAHLCGGMLVAAQPAEARSEIYLHGLESAALVGSGAR